MNNVNTRKLFNTLCVIALAFLRGTAWNNLVAGESLLADLKEVREPAHVLIALPNGTLVYFNKDLRILRIKKADGRTHEFKAERKQNEILHSHKWTGEKESLFGTETVLCSYLVNIKSFANADGIVLLHRNGAFRVVQLVDADLKVTKFFKDRLVTSYFPDIEPFALTGGKTIAAITEEGEISFYDFNGKVQNRLAFKGIFNESRIIEPRKLSAQDREIMADDIEQVKERLRFYAKKGTEALAARDKLLPPPVFIKGEEIPQSIKAMESRDNGNIIIVDCAMTEEELEKVKKGDMAYRYQKFYELDPEKAEIGVLQIPGFKLLRENIDLKKEKGDEIKDDDIWYDEIIIDIRCKNDVLCILTRYRAITVELNPELRITGEFHFRHDSEKYNGEAWDVTYNKPVKFLVVNFKERKIEECQPVAEMVGKPLDRGFAAEKRREKERKRIEILAMDEIDRRNKAWQTRTPVSDSDKDAVIFMFRSYLHSSFKGDLNECASFYHDDFIYNRSYVNKRFVEEHLPDFISSSKDIKSVDTSEVEIKINDASYGSEARDTVRVEVKFTARSAESGDKKSDKMVIRFIRQNDQWLFYDFE